MEIKQYSAKILKFNKTKKIKCPTCNKASVEPYSPFCSNKCSNIDLIKWLSDEINDDSDKN